MQTHQAHHLVATINPRINIPSGFLSPFDRLNAAWDSRACNFLCLLHRRLSVTGIRSCGWDLEVGGFFGASWCDAEVLEVCGVRSRVYGSAGGFIHFCLGATEKVSSRSRCPRRDWLVSGFLIAWGWEEAATAMAEKLLDFTQPLDVGLLDATVAAFYGTGSKEEVHFVSVTELRMFTRFSWLCAFKRNWEMMRVWIFILFMMSSICDYHHVSICSFDHVSVSGSWSCWCTIFIWSMCLKSVDSLSCLLLRLKVLNYC